MHFSKKLYLIIEIAAFRETGVPSIEYLPGAIKAVHVDNATKREKLRLAIPQLF